MLYRSICITLIILFNSVIPLLSQTATATLLGTIRDPSDALVPGAQVSVLNVSTGIERRIHTDELGNYAVPLLQPGNYEISVEMTGFKKYIQTGINVLVGDRARVDMKLETGDLSTIITVKANASLLEKDSSTLGAVVDNNEVTDDD